MRYFAIMILVSFSSSLFGQDLKLIEKQLINAFNKIDYWRDLQSESGYNTALNDSLGNANDTFEKILLQSTSNYEQTLYYSFKKLIDSGVAIATSKDGLFRIYSWDTQTGGDNA
jgi:hypothetical protein